MPRSTPGRAIAAAAAAALVLLLAACGPASHPTLDGVETREVETATGAILVPAAPQRIVALDGAGAALDGTAVVPIADVADAASGIGTGLLAGDVDVMAVAALEPDLLLATLPASALDDADVMAALDELRELAPIAVFEYADRAADAAADGPSRLDAGIALGGAVGIAASLSTDRIDEAIALVAETGAYDGRTVALALADGETAAWASGMLAGLGATVLGADQDAEAGIGTADVVLATDPAASLSGPLPMMLDGRPAIGVATLDPAGTEQAIAVLLALLLGASGAV